MELREQRPVPYLQVCRLFLFVYFVLTRDIFFCPIIRLYEFFDCVWKNSPSRFCFDCHTGTGSDVKAPKKPQRPRPSHTVNSIHKHSSANQNETGAGSRQSATNIPALVDGNSSQCSKNSPGKQTDSQSTNQNGLDVEPNISANTQHAGQNNRDWDAAKPAVKNSSSSHHKDSALTSPQKHREKRKHCDSADSDKRKHKKRKHSKDSRCEGHRISHLVKKRAFEKAESEDKETEKKSDDYVLAKLFRKSGRLFCAQTPSATSDMVYLVSLAKQ